MRTEIIYENKELLVVRKPAGLAVQTAHPGRPDVVSELKNHLSTGRPPYLGVIHRLDQPVEGVLVFAKTPKAAAALTEQMQSGALCKEYLAVVCGQPDGQKGRLVDHLVKEKGTARIVDPAVCAEAKQAVLSYRVEESRVLDEKKISLLRIVIETGRFHQIRVQLSHAGIPILGDARYGTEENIRFAAKNGVKDVALCAVSLSFTEPAGGKRLCYAVEPQNPAFALFAPHEK